MQTKTHHIFKSLNSFLAQLAGELWSCKVMQETWLRWDYDERIYHTPTPKVQN